MNKTDSIKIEIANRTYPLKVSADQVAIIEKAALVVNERLKEYEIAFGVRDLQDLLAMCALHMAAEQLGFQKNRELQEDEINKVAFDNRIDKSLPNRRIDVLKDIKG
ncbi:MAG: cell division protein ZapA [Bacteroidetes bacterium]|nr:cell division protein ZapA [Bacteroidota bacterium]